MEKKLGVMRHTCHPSYDKKHKIGRSHPGWSGEKAKLYLQK
jgi:hypothetical protein